MNKFIALCSAFLFTLIIGAQNIKTLYTTSPDTLFQTVDSINRAKMCQLKIEGVDKGAVTIFGDTIMVDKLTDNYLSYRCANEYKQLLLIDNIIVAVTTVNDESSEITFYNQQWGVKSRWMYGVHNSKYMPDAKSIYNAIVVKPEDMSASDYERLLKYLDPLTVSVELLDTDNTITLYPHCPLLTKDEEQEIKAVLKSKTFKWTKGKFK